MLFPSLVGHAAELYRIIWKSPQPADAIASEFFRSHKYIGSKERKFISESVFATLRIHSIAQLVATSYSSEYRKESIPLAHEIKIILAACLFGERVGAYSPLQLLNRSFVTTDETFSIEQLCKGTLVARLEYTEEETQEWINASEEAFRKVALEDSYTYWCLPEWIAESWHHRDVKPIALSLLKSAPVCLRVNTRAISRERVLEELAKLSIAAKPSTLSPDGIVLDGRDQLSQVELFKSGAIEVQDIGSQIIGYALAPEEDWLVLDACAGAGGKSLHIAAMQNDSGTVISTDIEFKRLRELDFRAKRAGFRSISTMILSPKNDKTLEKFIGRCDAVLVDAPCSGMGTARRMPMVKWRLTASLVAKLARKQCEILLEKSRFVRPDGVLVYATCSMMPQENEDVVNRFLMENDDFVLEPLDTALSQFGIKIQGMNKDAGMMTLLPNIHGTDGFFIARMRRIG
ncbi:MAG: RsmB/NOP family class I SAM-dependent RNA methyltransferase [Candidatus Doudnabacteria bacterium]|nr:RsmB/NOP family class I SAM-dependent RNA methyltransferase [Candidatus Doudnabacteria bacterium]